MLLTISDERKNLKSSNVQMVNYDLMNFLLKFWIRKNCFTAQGILHIIDMRKLIAQFYSLVGRLKLNPIV